VANTLLVSGPEFDGASALQKVTYKRTKLHYGEDDLCLDLGKRAIKD